MTLPALRSRPAWVALEQHAQAIKNVHLRQLFAYDPARGEKLSVEAAGIHLHLPAGALLHLCGASPELHLLLQGTLVHAVLG